jgi:hypothetical protein
MKYYKHILTTLSLFIIFIFSPGFVQARTVSETIRTNISFDSARGVLEWFCTEGRGCLNPGRVYRLTFNNIGSGSNNPVQETLVTNLTKNIDLQKGGSNMNSSFNMLVGETTNLRTSSTSGNWSIQGRSVGANMDGQRYRIYRSGDRTLEASVSSPRDNNSPNLSSSNNNVISCSGTNCTARGAGTATIRASFSNSSGTVNSRFWYEKRRIYTSCSTRCGQGSGTDNTQRINELLTSQKDFSANYSFPDIIWNVTVTVPNDTPTVSLNQPSPNGYTGATFSWNYSDKENNPQARYQIQASTDNIFSTSGIRFNRTFSGSISNSNISSLISGVKHYIRVRVADSYDSNRWSAWSNIREVTPENYPEPNVNFSLSGGNPIQTVNYPNLLTLKTGDKVSANWNITNTVGVINDSCRISTENIEGGDTTKILDRSGQSFVTSINPTSIPTSPVDQTYQIRLQCDGKPAAQVRNINETIRLKVESYPTVSCRIEGNSTLREGNTKVRIIAEVRNVNSYTWKIGKFSTDTKPLTGGPNSDLNLSRELDYTGVAFGRYTPWVEVARTDNPSRTDKKNCSGTVSNLGRSNIREVN